MLILNNSADYALRAVLFIARRNGNGPANADVIAEALDVPRNYLGKILHQLVRAHVLTSVRGPNGGFSLAASPGSLALAQIIEPFQSLAPRSQCLLSDRACNPRRPCVSHKRWQTMTNEVGRFFKTTTVELMLEEIS